MIAAIPIASDSKIAKLYKRFARSPYLAIIDTNTKSIQIVKNNYSSETKGVGQSVIDLLITEYHVDCLIAFELGLKIQKIANSNKMRLIILHREEQSLEDILKLLHL